MRYRDFNSFNSWIAKKSLTGAKVSNHPSLLSPSEKRPNPSFDSISSSAVADSTILCFLDLWLSVRFRRRLSLFVILHVFKVRSGWRALKLPPTMITLLKKQWLFFCLFSNSSHGEYYTSLIYFIFYFVFKTMVKRLQVVGLITGGTAAADCLLLISPGLAGRRNYRLCSPPPTTTFAGGVCPGCCGCWIKGDKKMAGGWRMNGGKILV